MLMRAWILSLIWRTMNFEIATWSRNRLFLLLSNLSSRALAAIFCQITQKNYNNIRIHLVKNGHNLRESNPRFPLQVNSEHHPNEIQGSRKCGSTGAAFLGNSRVTELRKWCKLGKRKKKEKQEKKMRTKGKWGKENEEEKEKERRQGLNNYENMESWSKKTLWGIYVICWKIEGNYRREKF